MKNLADIRHSMRAISDTRQITGAMRLISISKMQKALARYESNKLFFDRVRAAMKDILTHSRDIHHPFLERQEAGIPAYVVIAADKGLCGGYNHNLLEFANQQIEQVGEKMILTIGQEARAYFARKNIPIDVEFLHIEQDPSLYSARKLAEELTNLYVHNSINEVNIIFTRFISTFKQEPTMIKVLPILLEGYVSVDLESEYMAELIYMPSPEEVLDTLVPQYIVGLVYGTLVQAYASEHCARMVAMENATKSADEMLDKLSIERNRVRQFNITSEISEIVSAMETMK